MAPSLLVGALGAIVIFSSTAAQPPAQQRDQLIFEPVVIEQDIGQATIPADAPDLSPRPARPATERPTPTSSPAPRRTARPTSRPRSATPRPKPPRTSHSVAGLASWYCKAGVSICHYRYPPGSMVAAACGKLRAAIGPNWRGRDVTVSANGRTIVVRLVDWCGSRTKTIDLYWEPMRQLGGTGVLQVKVRW